MYPVIERTEVASYIAGRHDGTRSAADFKTLYRGSAATDHVETIDDALDSVLDDWRALDLNGHASDQSRDAVEGRLSVVLHSGLKDLPAYVLTDRDFWRYCSVFLYEFVVWRQQRATATGLLPYFGAASSGLGRECVPHRMFNRAHIVKVSGEAAGDDDAYALATFGAADVWKSHVLRVANGNAPLVVREILTDVRDGRLKTEVIRPFIKNVRRVRANVLFEVLEQDQARAMVDRELVRTTAATVSLDDNDNDS